MTQHEQWQLEGTAAELYQRYLVPLITSLWAADLSRFPLADQRIGFHLAHRTFTDIAALG